MVLYFYSDKLLSHYKTYDFRKLLIPDAFKHVRLQNTLNSCKVHLILPLTVDYASFLLKCINYQQVRKILQGSCDRAVSCKNLARMPLHPKTLQELYILLESCKIFLTCKNLAKSCKKYFFCQLRFHHLTNNSQDSNSAV